MSLPEIRSKTKTNRSWSFVMGSAWIGRLAGQAWATGTMDIDVPQPVAHMSGVYPIQRFMVKGLLDAVPGLSWCGESRLSIVFRSTMEGVRTSSDG